MRDFDPMRSTEEEWEGGTKTNVFIYRTNTEAQGPKSLTLTAVPCTFSPNLVGEAMPRDANDLLHGTLDLLVLKALSWEPMHGFGLSKWIELRTKDELTIVDSALYKALHRLEDSGAIAAEWGVSDNNRRAKYYSLTPVRVQNRIVYRETPFNGTATPGDLLLVRVDAAGSPDWRYLVIEDPLPAGVEAVQQRNLYELEQRTEFWDGSRREYRDDRVVFFQESFTAGHYQFAYLLKVTTPGVFRAMPAQISAMYVPGATASSEPQTLTVGADPRLAGTRK